MQKQTLQIESFTGEAIAPYINDIGMLRILFFHDYPYLYTGDIRFERAYGATLAKNEKAVVILLKEGERVEGGITGMPLATFDEYKKAFQEKKISVEGVFMIGEMMLHTAFQGQGYEVRLLEQIEKFAKTNGYKKLMVAEVNRSPDDPRRPKNYTPMEKFWEEKGFKRVQGIQASCVWKELGDDREISHEMFFLEKFISP